MAKHLEERRPNPSERNRAGPGNELELLRLFTPIYPRCCTFVNCQLMSKMIFHTLITIYDLILV